jgi:hypothetical protein
MEYFFSFGAGGLHSTYQIVRHGLIRSFYVGLHWWIWRLVRHLLSLLHVSSCLMSDFSSCTLVVVVEIQIILREVRTTNTPTPDRTPSYIELEVRVDIHTLPLLPSKIFGCYCDRRRYVYTPTSSQSFPFPSPTPERSHYSLESKRIFWPSLDSGLAYLDLEFHPLY